MSEEKAIKAAIIEEAFGWLKDYTVSEIDGKRMMTAKGEQVPFNVKAVLLESHFIRDWLIPFALGISNGRNYFPVAQWMEISEDGSQSVMVVSDEKPHKPILIIPPLSSNNMGPEQFRAFRRIEHAIKMIANDGQRQGDPMASAALAGQSKNALKDVKQRTITELVSPWYYEAKGIVPLVEQQLYFIYENINNKAISLDELSAARPILYKAHRNQFVSNSEKELITKLVKDQYDVDFGTGAETSPQQAAAGNNEPDYDPNEC